MDTNKRIFLTLIILFLSISANTLSVVENTPEVAKTEPEVVPYEDSTCIPCYTDSMIYMLSRMEKNARTMERISQQQLKDIKQLLETSEEVSKIASNCMYAEECPIELLPITTEERKLEIKVRKK